MQQLKKHIIKDSSVLALKKAAIYTTADWAAFVAKETKYKKVYSPLDWCDFAIQEQKQVPKKVHTALDWCVFADEQKKKSLMAKKVFTFGDWNMN